MFAWTGVETGISVHEGTFYDDGGLLKPDCCDGHPLFFLKSPLHLA